MLPLACLLAMASAALAAAPPKPAPKPATAPPAKPAPLTPTHLTKWDDFLILTDRNIFDRNRRPPVVRTPRIEASRPPYTPPQPPPIDTDQYVVLLGIGLEGPQYTAFFEDSRVGKILQISPGGVVGKGRLRAVNLDSVQYDRGGKFIIVKVGCTLTGVQAASMGFAAPAPIAVPAAAGSSRAGPPAPAAPSPTAAPTTAPATTQPTTAPSAGETPAPAPAPDGLQDILERMRLRRQQELGR
jgi:hypothetical protein